MTQYYTLKDRFWYDMSELYSVQKNALNLLPTIANESGNAQLQNLLQDATQHTRQHIQNLDQCFQSEGIEPSAVTGDTVMGLRQEHAMLDATHASKDQILAYDIHAAAKILAYEIAAYRAVADIARLLGNSACQETLQTDLTHVEQLNNQLEGLRNQIGQGVGAGS